MNYNLVSILEKVVKSDIRNLITPDLTANEYEYNIANYFKLLEQYKREDARNMIKQNIYRNRNGKKTKVGMMKAFNIDGKVRVGFSLCSKYDDFSQELAENISSERAWKDKIKVPSSLRGELEAFLLRAKRYFKDCDMPEIVAGTYEFKTCIDTWDEPCFYLANSSND